MEKIIELGMNITLTIWDTDYALSHLLDNKELKRAQLLGMRLK